MNPMKRASVSDLTTYTILCNGSPLPARYQVEYIDIRSMANRISAAEVAFIDGDAAAQQFALSAAGDLNPGAEIEILLGYHRQESPLFKGVLLRQQIKTSRSGQSRLVISCRDRCFVLAQAARSAHFSSLSDADLISQLCSKHSISADVASTALTHTDIVQLRETDWDFIVRRAERNGLAVFTRDGTLTVVEVTPAPATLTLSYGRNLLDLDLQLDARRQFASTDATGWAAAEQASTVQDSSGDLSSPGALSTAELASASGEQTLALRVDGSVNPQALQTWANAARKRQQLAKVLGTLSLQGTAEVRCGDWVKLEGLGAQFDGEAWVGGVLHSMSRGKWLTTIQVGQDPQWHMERFQAQAAAAPQWQPQRSGLHIGKVVQLENDPDGEERIQVKIPTLGDEHEGVWARLASSDAGNQRGWVLRPEIGDEVILGFIDADAEQPVVLGRLHSSANPAPLAAADDNHEKGWVTRSGIKLLCNDDKISLLLETPAGNSVLLDEDEGAITIKDQNGNEWVMNSDGIALSSPADISIKSQKDIKLQGTNISIEANANLDVKGGANTTLEGGAVTTVKGSLVQIN